MICRDLSSTWLSVQPGQVHSHDLQRARKREEGEVQPESDACRDGNLYTTGVWYKRGHGTRMSELFTNSRK